RSVVVSGVESGVLAVAQVFSDQGRKTSRLKVSHAFHSPLMEPMLQEFAAVVNGLEFAEPSISMLSDVAGPEYWVRHVRDAVRFADQVAELDGLGVTRFLEIGPGGVLTALTGGCLPDSGILAVPSLRADRPEVDAIITALSRLHVSGVGVDWSSFFVGGRRVELPTYAFQHERYWLDAPLAADAGVGGTDLVEAGFWETVERQDVVGLAATLRMTTGELDTVLPRLSAWRKERREQSAVDGWRYRVTWKPLTGFEDRRPSGLWLVLVPAGQSDGHLTSSCLRALSQHGAVPLPIAVGPDIGRTALARQIVHTIEVQEAPVAGVLSLLALAEPARDVVPRIALSALLQAQALGDAGVRAPLWCATRGAVSTGRSDVLTQPSQSTVWGLGRVVGLEHSDRWGGLVDLPRVVDDRAAARLVSVLAGGTDEDQFAVRASGVLVRRLVRASSSSNSASWTPRGTVLVTGGTGALGGHVARWLGRCGAERVVLTSRRGVDAPGVAELVAEVESFGAQVSVAACDVADRAAVESLLAEIDAEGQLTAVVHTAGRDHLGSVDVLDEQEFADVLSAKVAGAVHLDDLLGDRELDAFVLFSSIAGVWGSGHQAAYAAANAFLDGLALNRRSRGLVATSVSWGPWADGGMADAGDAEEQLRRRGLARMPARQAVAALHGALSDDEPTLTVVDVEWERFAPTFTVGRPSPFLDDLPEVRQALSAEALVSSAGSTLVARLSTLPVTEQDRVLVEVVRSRAAVVLGHGAGGAVEADRAFKDLGFDSLTAVELRNRLLAETGVRLAATVVFDFPSPAALAAHLFDELDTGPAPATDPVLARLTSLESLVAELAAYDLTGADVAGRLREVGERLAG
ncbi:MAG TPA: SDR family NAD(P)-dependent oxidoreductase, partial [Umezawaea sp.]|nr:SDR family NAD(P)-dependent oxidoreductase [Umezawaea sp.]